MAKDQARPVISSPVGPIKSSRGPDLVRSDAFRLVHGIDDCQSPTAAAPRPDEADSPLSPAFPRQEEPLASPAPTQSGSRFLRRPSFPSFGKSRPPKSLLPTSSTASALPGQPRNAEKKHPPVSYRGPLASPEPAPQSTSKLPKSRTMNVLHDLKKSISRQNLAARLHEARRAPGSSQPPQTPQTPAYSQMPQSTRLPPSSQMPQSARLPAFSQMPFSARSPAPSQWPHSATFSTFSQMPHSAPLPAENPSPGYIPTPSQQQAIRRKPVPSRNPEPSRLPVSLQSPASASMPPRRYAAAPSTPQAPPAGRNPAAPAPQSAFSVSSSSSSTTLEGDRSQVMAAKPMEYWTGRFSRLNDKYMAEDRAPETLLALRSGLVSQHRHINPQSVDEDDARHLHIFAQLDFLCATEEAKKSLWEFQQVLARRFNRPVLLPRGGTMGQAAPAPASRLPVSRRFSTGGRATSHTMGPYAGDPSNMF